MAELTVRDGMPPPVDLPRGDFSCTLLPNGRISIDHADPRILISGELLDAIAAVPTSNAWMDLAGCMPPPYRATYVGAVLKISGVNQQVIYRITEYVPSVHGYIGQWPD